MSNFILETLQSNGFTISKEVTIGVLAFLVDDENKKFAIGSPTKVTIYDFCHLIDFELNEDGNSIMKGRGIATAVGGLTFGLLGAAVGAMGRRKSEGTCTSLTVRLMLNDLSEPQKGFDYISHQVKKKSILYKQALEDAQTFVGVLNYIDHYNSTVQKDVISKPITFEYIKNKRKKKAGKWRKGLYITIAVIMALIIIGIIESQESAQVTSTGVKSSAVTSEKTPSKIVQKMMKVTGMSEAEANNAMKVLDSVNVKEKNIVDIVRDDTLDGLEGEISKGYRVIAFLDEIKIVMYLANNHIKVIRYADVNYYKDGEVLTHFITN